MSGAKGLIFFSHEYVGQEPDNGAFTRDERTQNRKWQRSGSHHLYVLEFALAVPTT
jgi:hypothetical protein